MHVRRERVNLSPHVNTSKLFEFKKKLNAEYLQTNGNANFCDFTLSGLQSYLARCCFDNNNVTDDLL
jgi:hypothetical protein